MNGRPDTEFTLKINNEFLCPQPRFMLPASWWASSSTAAFPFSSSFSSRPFTLCQRASPAVWSPSSAISSQACSFSFSPSTSQVNYTHRVGLTLKINCLWMFQTASNWFLLLFRSQVVSVFSFYMVFWQLGLIDYVNKTCKKAFWTSEEFSGLVWNCYRFDYWPVSDFVHPAQNYWRFSQLTGKQQSTGVILVEQISPRPNVLA